MKRLSMIVFVGTAILLSATACGVPATPVPTEPSEITQVALSLSWESEFAVGYEMCADLASVHANESICGPAEDPASTLRVAQTGDRVVFRVYLNPADPISEVPDFSVVSCRVEDENGNVLVENEGNPEVICSLDVP